MFKGRSAGDVFESLLPLIVGITLCSIAHTTRAIARSIVILSLGAVGLITMLANSSSGGRGRAGMGGMGMGLSLSHVSERDVIFVLGWTCLLIGAGIVFYRPGKLLGFILGCVGGGLACLSWLIPEGGSSIPLIEVFKTFRHSVAIALGMLCWMGMTIASSVLCFVNLPSKPARVLHSTSRLAVCLMVGGLLVFSLFFMLTPLLMSSPGFKMEVGDRFKAMFSMLTFILTAGVAVLGKILLVPLGVVDLLVGRADR